MRGEVKNARPEASSARSHHSHCLSSLFHAHTHTYTHTHMRTLVPSPTGLARRGVVCPPTRRPAAPRAATSAPSAVSASTLVSDAGTATLQGTSRKVNEDRAVLQV